MTVIGRKDDPAFLYFPTNYRWSMGLLICLGAAPWTGIEIDEVHRVGSALEDHVGEIKRAVLENVDLDALQQRHTGHLGLDLGHLARLRQQAVGVEPVDDLDSG